MFSKELLKTIKKRKYVALVIVLSLSAFVHLWNVADFPDLFYDEGVYMRRALHVMSEDGLQERYFYDHPYFGQIFLAGTLSVMGYPASLHVTTDASSIEMLYMIPRMLMGFLAIADTFLIFKISEKYYNTKVGQAASLLFSVMPITWITRRILLESILLPFLLLSILLLIYCKESKNKSVLVILSGICMGIALFTKADMVVMLPFLVFLLYKNTSLRSIGLWFIPVILIPMIWPAESFANGQFNYWLNSILFETGRNNGGLPYLLGGFFQFDPVLFLIGFSGIVYFTIRRELAGVLWCVPFLIFFSLIHYVQYFYWIPVIPILCIVGGRLLLEVKQQLGRVQVSHIALVAIAVFGIASTSLLITTNVSSQFQATSFVANYLDNHKDATVISNPVYSWIFYYVYHDKNVFADYRDLIYCPIQTKNTILVSDPHFQSNLGVGKELAMVYENTTTIKNFSSSVLKYDTAQYPFTNLLVNLDGSKIDIRISDKPIDTGIPPDENPESFCNNNFD